MKSFYQKNKKTVHVVGGIAIGIITLAFLLPKRDTTGGDNFGITEDETGTGGNVFDAQSVANQLFVLMNSKGYFNSIDILKVFTDRVPKTNSAFDKLLKAFGKKRYNAVTRDDTWYPFAEPKDLIYWLKRETIDDHYQTIRSHFPNQPWI